MSPALILWKKHERRLIDAYGTIGAQPEKTSRQLSNAVKSAEISASITFINFLKGPVRTMFLVTGQTFHARHLLKEFGGRWDNDTKGWAFYHLEPAQIARLRGIPGIYLSEPPPEPAEPPRAPTAIYGDDPTYFNYFRDKDPAVFFGFSSMAAFVDYVEALHTSNDTDRDHAWRTNEKYKRFSATEDMAEALNLARHGWSDGLGLMEKFKIPHAFGKRHKPSIVGGRVNVGRLLAGNPVHMVHRKPAPRNRIITIFIETTMWSGIKPLNMMMRAFIIAGIVDVLEIEGYVCELIAVYTTSYAYDPCTQFAVKVKQAGQALNMLDITFACGHPSFLRRLMFACEGNAPECPHVGAVIQEAFDTEHLPGRNEFYIPQLMPGDQAQLTGDPLDMLRFLEPGGLPIKIRERI